MKSCLTGLLFYLPCLLLTSGCLSPGTTESLAIPLEGRDRYTLSEKTARSAAGCRYHYRTFNPVSPETTTTVVLGHGFLRDQDNMIGLSRELANAGIRVVTLDFCNMRPWNGHHERNAQDMRDLSELLGLSGDVIYAGFSAGGLAAVLAADDSTRAIATLDLVDQNNLGLNAIEKLTTPLLGLSGPASSCNAMGNGAAVFNARTGRYHSELTQVDGASHCEFETPSNWLCEIACGDEGDKEADEHESHIIVRLIVKKLAPYLTLPRG